MINEQTPRILIENHFRFLPCLLAEKVTKGKFKRYNYVKYISQRIAKSIAKGNGRIILSIPPRHGKSFLVSQWVPTWYLSLRPTHNVILTSYEADFAAQWGRLVRNIIDENQATLNISLAQDSSASNRWNTTQGGGMLTAGVGGPVTGRGGHLILVDDPVKNWEQATSEVYRQKTIEWFNSTLYTRLEPNGTIIVIMTRWHENDLAGYLLREHSDGWDEIRLPSIAEENDIMGRSIGEALNPERYDSEALSRIKTAIGSKMWNALYQQRPAAEEGNIIKRQWLKYYEKMPPINYFTEIIQSWDCTFTKKETSDFVVGTVWGRRGSEKYLLDIIRDRLGITDTMQAIKSLSMKWPQATLKLIENKANGPAIEEMLQKQISGLVLVEPMGDKVARLNAAAPQFEAGNVYLPAPVLCALWLLH
jgi:predicted phage terminase large subunit-like protein